MYVPFWSGRAVSADARYACPRTAHRGRLRGIHRAALWGRLQALRAPTLRRNSCANRGLLASDYRSGQTAHDWGGSFENRARFIVSILNGVRAACRPDFQVGLRLSPERFGLQFAEVRELAQTVMQSGQIDWLDLSIWDVTKEPEDTSFAGRNLLSWFTDLDRANTRLGVAGKILGARSAAACLQQGADFVLVGRGAILAHDFPNKVRGDDQYRSPALPVTADHLPHRRTQRAVHRLHAAIPRLRRRLNPSHPISPAEQHSKKSQRA